MKRELVLVLVVSFFVKTSAHDYGLNNDKFVKFLDEIYRTPLKESEEVVFIRNFWDPFQAFLTISAKIPGIELVIKGLNTYMCAKPATMTLSFKKLNGDSPPIVVRRTFNLQENKVELEIYIRPFIDPVYFDVVFKEESIVTDLMRISYLFGKNSWVKLILKIPDFPVLQRSLLDAKCLVTIKEVQLSYLGDTSFNQDATSAPNKIDQATLHYAKTYWSYMRLGALKEEMSKAIVRELKEKLNKQSEFWICASDEFKKSYDSELKLSASYNTYCGTQQMVTRFDNFQLIIQSSYCQARNRPVRPTSALLRRTLELPKLLSMLMNFDQLIATLPPFFRATAHHRANVTSLPTPPCNITLPPLHIAAIASPRVVHLQY